MPGSISVLPSIPLTHTSRLSHGSWNGHLVRQGLQLGKTLLTSVLGVCITRADSSAGSIIPLMAKFASKNMQAEVQPLSLQLGSYRGTFCGTGGVTPFTLYKFSKLFLLLFMSIIKVYQTIIKINYIKLA